RRGPGRPEDRAGRRRLRPRSPRRLTVEVLPVTGLAALNDRLGRPVADATTLAAALAHRSWCAENPGHESNERLEFLGDAVLGLLGDRISEASEGPGGQDYKTRLQELVARHFTELPRYAIRDEGPDHAKRFFAEVRVGGQARGRGEGRSKKQAEAAAARSAW